jgi:hypothetical protein
MTNPTGLAEKLSIRLRNAWRNGTPIHPDTAADQVERLEDALDAKDAEIARLKADAAHLVEARPGEEYHDDFGPVMWHRFPIEEAPWVGMPEDSDWPGYHTHFTILPPYPHPVD